VKPRRSLPRRRFHRSAHFFCRFHPPEDDADGPVGGGTAQDDLSLVEELSGIGHVLRHHGLLLVGHGGEEVRAFRAKSGEEGEGRRHD